MEQSNESLVSKLNKIGIALSSEHNLEKLLGMIVRELRSFTNADGGTLYTKEGDELSFEVAQNDTLTRRYGDAPFKSFKIPISHKSIAGHVVLSGTILNIPNFDEVDDEVPFSLETMRKFDKKMDYKSVSMLAVPMRNHKDEIIGVIQLFNSLDENNIPVPFDKNTEELVISLASQAAVAICNSLLIQDIKNLFESIVTYSAEAIDARSPHTAGHSERVATLTMMLAESINKQKEGPYADVEFSDEELTELRMAAFLHDIGKIGVRERVLDKAKKLTDDRVESIKNRFAFIKRDVENSANLQKLSTPGLSSEEIQAVDEKTAKKIEELDSDLDLILRLNIPKYYSDEDGEQLKEAAGKKYTDINGGEQPLITPGEYEFLLVRKGNLTADERTDIENHVVHTVKILNKIPFTEELKNIPSIAASHHEMLNGTGYPNKLTAKDISLKSRMLAIVDIYDALSAKDRPYKPPLPLKITLKIIREEADNGRLDKDLVELFVSKKVYEDL